MTRPGSSSGKSYVSSRLISARWEHGVAIVDHRQRTTSARVSARTLELLTLLQEPRKFDDLVELLPRWSALSVQHALDKLVLGGFVLDDDAQRRDEDMIAKRWDPWTSLARDFHFGTRDLRYVGGDASKEFFQARRPRQPPFVRCPAGEPRILPMPSLGSREFGAVLSSRRSVREYSDAALQLADVATLLGLTWGVQGVLQTQAFGPLFRKTSPSGGARHPIDAYLISQNVDGLDSGVYFYNPVDHSLIQTQPRISRAELDRAFESQPWVATAPAVFVMAAAVERSMWKYRFARAYRIILMDAGHLGQTFQLVCTALGLATAVTAAFHDSTLERLVGLTDPGEPALYVGIAGVPRP